MFMGGPSGPPFLLKEGGKMNSLEKKILEILSPPIEEMGYSIEELAYSGNGKIGTLKVVVDRPDPINLDDIVLVTDKISSILDEEDPIENAYNLDVSSLGVEKPIKIDKLGDYLGEYVHLHLTNPYNGENDLEGTLKEKQGDNYLLTIRVKQKSKDILIDVKDIDKARKAIKF